MKELLKPSTRRPAPLVFLSSFASSTADIGVFHHAGAVRGDLGWWKWRRSSGVVCFHGIHRFWRWWSWGGVGVVLVGGWTSSAWRLWVRLVPLVVGWLVIGWTDGSWDWWGLRRRFDGWANGGRLVVRIGRWCSFLITTFFLLQDCSSVVSQELFCIPLLWYVGDGLPNLWCPSIGCYVALPLLYHLGTFCRGKLEGIERHGWRGVQIVDCGEGLQEEEIWFFVFPISLFFISYFFILIKENDISIFKNKTKRILLVFKENTQD